MYSLPSCYFISIGYQPLMVACQSQVSVLNKLLATKQRNITPPPLPSPAVRSRTISCNYEPASQFSSHSTNQILNSSAQGVSSEVSSLLDEPNYSAVSDTKANEDNISIASQRSTSSCLIS